MKAAVVAQREGLHGVYIRGGLAASFWQETLYKKCTYEKKSSGTIFNTSGCSPPPLEAEPPVVAEPLKVQKQYGTNCF